MKKFSIIISLFFLYAAWSCTAGKKTASELYSFNETSKLNGFSETGILHNSGTEPGNPQAGLEYILRGNGFNTGIPYDLYKSLYKLRGSMLARVSGMNKLQINDMVIFEKENKRVATIGCLHCHGQVFDGKMIIGLGNTNSNFYTPTENKVKLVQNYIQFRYGKNSPEFKNAAMAFAAVRVLGNKILTRMRGPSPAQRIAEVMASHRDPVTLRLREDTSYFNITDIVIPEDPPPLWIVKKRKALTVNAMTQGDLAKHIVISTLLTLEDSSEARIIYNNAKNVWAYLLTLEPPNYPYAIDERKATEGKNIFMKNCASCHGRYDQGESYPNKIIPPEKIGTDSLLWKYFLTYPGFTDWYNKSWFATSANPSYFRPQRGYVAPPLDGIWITAPYLHNGSVPNLEVLLNSKERPRYWKRNFKNQEYDYGVLGWKYKSLDKAGGPETYNTEIPGYGNYGHRFGDHLSSHERSALIEYLKTL